MYINSFLTELSKKIDTVEEQLKDFEDMMAKINEVKSMLTLKTLKDIDELKGEDLALLDKEDFLNILNAFNFDNKEEKLKTFFKASVSIKVYQKLVSDGEIKIENQDVVESYIKWLDDQVLYIKEYIKDFNNNNKEYYNSLKISDNIYKKYLSYFDKGKLIKPIYDLDGFNEVIKKSGIISTEKWQILKYVGEKNLEFMKKKESKTPEKVEYEEEEILSFAAGILDREKKLISKIDEDLLKESIEFMDYDDAKLKSLNLTEEKLIIYQKVPILDTIKKIYDETKNLLKTDKDEDAKKIEKNLKDLLQLVDSYDVIKKIES